MDEIAEKLGKITELAYMISVKCDYIVHANYSGHVNQIDVRICHKPNYSDWISSNSFYVDGETGVELLESLYQKLKYILDTGNLPALEPHPVLDDCKTLIL
nr:hypothetical protein [Aneurinibacillus sp. XH2]